MANDQIYYKWQNVILPDPMSKEFYGAPELIRYISHKTFTDREECLKAAREQEYSFPSYFKGPSLSLLSSQNKQNLEILEANNRGARINANDVTVQEEQIDKMYYYKWQIAFIPGFFWKEPIYFEISEKTYTNMFECQYDSHGWHKNLEVPLDWRGAYLQVLRSTNKHALEEVYHKNIMCELTSFGDNITIYMCDYDDDTMELLKEMCQNIVDYSN